MSIGAVSGAVARGGGGAHGSVDLPRGIQDLVTGRAGTVPAVVGGTACAPESPRQPRAHSAERPILAAATPRTSAFLPDERPTADRDTAEDLETGPGAASRLAAVLVPAHA